MENIAYLMGFAAGIIVFVMVYRAQRAYKRAGMALLEKVEETNRAIAENNEALEKLLRKVTQQGR